MKRIIPRLILIAMLPALVAFGLLGLVQICPRKSPDNERGFLQRIYTDSSGAASNYMVFVPNDYQGDESYPLILFLHGAGERGSDGIKPTLSGLGPEIRKRENGFNFFVLFPQAASTWEADSNDGRRAIHILDEVERTYNIDTKRLYLTGLSMGGYGTWSLAFKYPTKWAAIVPICGNGDPQQAAKIKQIPCWCFHGAEDNVVNVRYSREMISALKTVGGNPRYTEYPGIGHKSWDKAYAVLELYQWLLRQQLQ